MIDAHVGDVPLTVKEATHCMKEAWARENDCKVVAWNAQLEQDRLEQEDRDRLAREDEEAQRVQREKEAEEQRKEAESKKPKADMFNPKRAVNGTIDPRLATYALNKVSNLEYVELDYFTVRSCREVHLDNYKSINQDTLAFTQLDDTIAIRPMAALRPSKHIRNDEDLSWEEMLAVKNLMLRWMAKSRVWLVTHVESLAEFYVNLEMHERAESDLGKRVLLLYQSWVRREWYDAFKHKEGFNISLIQDKLLCSMAEEVNGNIIFNEIKRICRTADAAFEANTSRHHREHGYRSSSHVRSRLPQRPTSSRKRCRSCSPKHEQVSPSDRPEKRVRDGDQSAHRENTGFFRSSAGPRGGACAVCLGCHEHTFSKCNGVKLWDGLASSARKNEQGRLVAADG